MAQELAKRRPDLKLYFPIKDVGVDLLAVGKNNVPISIQVKESRVYPTGHSWHEIKRKKIKDADIFVFISYVPQDGGAKTIFVRDFAVIPRSDLGRLCAQKKTSNGKYIYYFKQEGRRLLDIRDGRRDVSKFKSAWRLI